MMPHDPKDEDDEADDCTLPVDPLPSPFILSNGDSGVDTMQTSLGGMPTVPFSPNDVVAEEHEETHMRWFQTAKPRMRIRTTNVNKPASGVSAS
jgi:hypothetical protein